MNAPENTEASEADSSSSPARKPRISDDWLAVLCGGILLAFACGMVATNSNWETNGDESKFVFQNPLKNYVAKPGSWKEQPLDSIAPLTESKTSESREQPEAPKAESPTEEAPAAAARTANKIIGILGAAVMLGLLMTIAVAIRDGTSNSLRFAAGFVGIFALATIAYVMAGQEVVKAYNLEYALWALLVGFVISNTIGTPKLLAPAVQSEFFIKTGLVILGAEVLMSRLFALSIPGICVAWIVTPIVLISTYWFGQRVLKMQSRSLNMVISADMSVCGVSAAIASAAACKAKKEELSLAVGMSLSFTVLMMVVMPAIIANIPGFDPIVGAAWMGGTIDSTGAVAAAGSVLGEQGEYVATTVKMIQNILIGVSAFGIAVYWVTVVDRSDSATQPRVSEIWVRFPKFVLGFIAASIVFSLIHGLVPGGDVLVGGMVKETTKVFRGWLFCLAFVCIGLETRVAELWPYLKGGKPLLLYVCGQSLNLVLTLLMAWLMFKVVFGDWIESVFAATP